jgi:hypothetical protein
VDAALDRREISFIGRAQSDDAVAKRWIRIWERGGEEANRTTLYHGA